MPYVVQNLFLLLAPALFAASVYMILGRVVSVTDGKRFVSLGKIEVLDKGLLAADAL